MIPVDINIFPDKDDVFKHLSRKIETVWIDDPDSSVYHIQYTEFFDYVNGTKSVTEIEFYAMIKCRIREIDNTAYLKYPIVRFVNVNDNSFTINSQIMQNITNTTISIHSNGTDIGLVSLSGYVKYLHFKDIETFNREYLGISWVSMLKKFEFLRHTIDVYIDGKYNEIYQFKRN